MRACRSVRHLQFRLVTLTMGVLLVSALASGSDTQLRVGVAAIEITPKFCDVDTVDGSVDGPPFDEGSNCFRWVHLAGFSPYVPFVRNRIAEGVHDSLWARTLAVEGTNGETVVLVATDLPGLVWKHVNPVRRRVEQTLGVPAANVIIHSTHTHSAPDASGYWSTM